jgi:hypothetical protein
MKIQTKSDLDKILAEGCGNPECKEHHEQMSELFIHAQCHPEERGVNVCYNAEGLIKISCAICDRPIVNIAVK